jgi:hypothetical protein
LLEQERRENLGRQLSESESSLEMEDERYWGKILTLELGSADFSDRPTHALLGCHQTLIIYRSQKNSTLHLIISLEYEIWINIS